MDIVPALKVVISRENIVHFCHKNFSPNRIRLQKVIAAAIALSICTATVLYTNPQLTVQAKEWISSIIYALGISAEKTEGPSSAVKSLYAQLDRNIKLIVRDENEIDFSKISVVAVYEDGKTEIVPIEKCDVTVTRGVDGDNSKLLLVVGYEGCAFSITYTLEE